MAVSTLIEKASKDIKTAASKMTAGQARVIVDMYYQVQEHRKASDNQAAALEKFGEPSDLVRWLGKNLLTIEKEIIKLMDEYSDGHLAGRWAKSICGVGPVISAGLLANIDIEKAPTVGHIWNFAGLNSEVEWIGKERAKAMVKDVMGAEKKITDAHIMECANRTKKKFTTLSRDVDRIRGEKNITKDVLARALARRPWNARLKVLTWKVGQSFMKVSGLEDGFYGHLYKTRKAEEVRKSEAGELADQARAKLDRYDIGKSTDAYKAYSVGELPPAHLDARARRWAVKIFLSHYHHVAFWGRYGKNPPVPFVMAHKGHTHYIPPANWPFEGQGNTF